MKKEKEEKNSMLETDLDEVFDFIKLKGLSKEFAEWKVSGKISKPVLPVALQEKTIRKAINEGFFKIGVEVCDLNPLDENQTKILVLIIQKLFEDVWSAKKQEILRILDYCFRDIYIREGENDIDFKRRIYNDFNLRAKKSTS